MYWYFLLTILVFGGTPSLGALVTLTPTVFTPSVTGGVPLSIGVGASSCVQSTVTTQGAQSIIVLTNATTNYVVVIDALTALPRSQSSSVGAGFTTIWCPSAFCAAYNPTSQSFLAFGFASSSVLARTTPISIAALGTPSFINVVQRSSGATLMDVFVVIGDTNSVVYVVSFQPSGSTAGTTRTLLTLTNTAKIVGITAPTASNVLIAFDSDTTLYNYDFVTGAALGTYGTFGRVGVVVSDLNGRVYATDLNAGSIRIFDQTGVQTHVASGFTSPKAITMGRNAFFVQDDTTIYKVLHENMTMSDFSYTNMTCPTGAYATITASGGSYYYTYNVLPDQKNAYGTFFQLSQTTSGKAAIGPIYPRITGVPDYYLYDEGLGGSVGPPTTTTSMSFNPLSLGNPPTVLPYAGRYCAEYKIWNKGTVTLSFMNNYLDISMYSGIEYYFNPGEGNQTLNVTAFGNPRTILPYSYPNNQWTRIVHPLDPRQSAASGLSFVDVGTGVTNATNPFYVDRVRGIFQTAPRYPTVVDVCTSVTITGPNFDVYDSNMLAVTYKSISPSCDLDGVNDQRASDGQIQVNVTGGNPPYSYQWSFSSSTTSTSTGLPELDGIIPVYTNGLIPPFTDTSSSFGRITLDPTYYHSPPYSYSFTPASNNEGLIFESSVQMDGSAYSSINFWINGGALGGQYLIVQLKNGFQVVGKQVYLHQLVGLTVIPPDSWIQVVYPMRGANNIPFTSLFIVTPFVTRVTPRLYVDDVQLIVYNVSLTVNDSQGCNYRAPPIQLNYPAPVVATKIVSYAKCYGNSDGTLALNISGGTPPYSTTWTSSTGSSSLNALNESRVTLNVRDSNQCVPTAGTVIADILQPSRLQLISTITPAKCPGAQGSISAHLVGGAGTYTYAWLSLTAKPVTTPQPQTVVVFGDSLLSGFTLTDDHGGATPVCLGTGSQIGMTYSPSHSGYCSLQVAAVATANSRVFGFSCSNCMNNTMYYQLRFWILVTQPTDAGSLTMQTVSGSTSTASLPVFSSALPATPQWQYVSFNMPQTTSDSFYITSSSATSAIYIDSVILVPVASDTLVDGKRVNIGFTSVVSGPAGTYTAFVSDDNLCTLSLDFIITQPNPVTVTVTPVNPTGNSTGSITVSAQGGTPPYQYIWPESNTTGATLSNIAKGAYIVQVIDANGCLTEKTVVLDAASLVRMERAYDAKFSNGVSAIVAVGLAIWVFSSVMLFMHRGSFSKHGSFFSAVLLVGVLFANISSIMYLIEPSDATCILFPWFLGVAFVLSFGCLFIKTWTLYQVWRKASNYERSNLTPNYIIKCLGVTLLIEVVFLIIWTTVDPPKVRNQNLINNEQQLQCVSSSPVFWIIFISAKGIWLLFGASLAVLTRNVVKEYNESSAIAYAMYNILLLGVIAVPLALLLGEIPGGRTLIIVAIVTIAFTACAVIMFFNVWHKIYFSVEDKLSQAAARSLESRTTAASSGSRGSRASSKASKDSSHSSNSPPVTNSAQSTTSASVYAV